MFLSPAAIVARLENRRAKLQERLEEARTAVADARKALTAAIADEADLSTPTKALRKAEAVADDLAAELQLTIEVIAEKRGDADEASAAEGRKRLAEVLAVRQTAIARLQKAIDAFGEAWVGAVQASDQLVPLAPSDLLIGHALKTYTEIALAQATGNDLGRPVLGGTPVVTLTQRAQESSDLILGALRLDKPVQ